MTVKDIPAVMAIKENTTAAWSKNQLSAELASNIGWQFVCRQQDISLNFAYQINQPAIFMRITALLEQAFGKIITEIQKKTP